MHFRGGSKRRFGTILRYFWRFFAQQKRYCWCHFRIRFWIQETIRKLPSNNGVGRSGGRPLLRLYHLFFVSSRLNVLSSSGCGYDRLVAKATNATHIVRRRLRMWIQMRFARTPPDPKIVAWRVLGRFLALRFVLGGFGDLKMHLENHCKKNNEIGVKTVTKSMRNL